MNQRLKEIKKREARVRLLISDGFGLSTEGVMPICEDVQWLISELEKRDKALECAKEQIQWRQCCSTCATGAKEALTEIDKILEEWNLV